MDTVYFVGLCVIKQVGTEGEEAIRTIETCEALGPLTESTQKVSIRFDGLRNILVAIMRFTKGLST